MIKSGAGEFLNMHVPLSLPFMSLPFKILGVTATPYNKTLGVNGLSHFKLVRKMKYVQLQNNNFSNYK